MSMPSFQKKQRGVTLIELVICIVLLGIAASAMLTAFGNMMASSSDPLWHNKSIKLGQLFLDEILGKAYDETTPLGGLPVATVIDCNTLGPDDGVGPGDEIDEGNSRVLFDDVDDYHGIENAPENLTDDLRASYANYSVKVSVTCDDDNVVGASDTSNAKKITVSVLAPSQSQPMEFSAYKGNY